jgi:hypothetical protein
MKHSTCLEVFTSPNCFRTVIRNTGISRFYSVCVKDIYNLEEIAAVSGIRSCVPQTYTLSFTRVWKVVDKDLFYQQRPYKNIEYKEFKRRGRYIIVECFTSYANMNNISDALIEDSREIKSLLRIIKALYPKK